MKGLFQEFMSWKSQQPALRSLPTSEHNIKPTTKNIPIQTPPSYM